MADEFDFPEEIIRQMQSFLSTKESAQTSILSKSWYSAWSTRSVHVFDETDFPKTVHVDVPHPLPSFAKKTLNRYKRLNLKADKLVLRMKIRHSCHFNPLAQELIVSALVLCVNEIVLKFDNYVCVLPVSVRKRFDLPGQVFASTSLTRLSVDCYLIDVVIGDRVLCSRLTSLVLHNVSITDDVIRGILLGCPLIENLDLFSVSGLSNLNVSKIRNLVEFRIVGWRVSVAFMDLASTFGGRNGHEFCYMRKLHLQCGRVVDDFFTKFSSMFPCIEDLTLCIANCEKIIISSHSLRHLRLHAGEMLNKIQLNVPNISNFVFQADYMQGEDVGEDTAGTHFKPLPSLSFDNVSRDWESDVKLVFYACHVIEALLFVDLRKFLVELARSRISLSISFDGLNIVSGEEIPGLPSSIPVLENLTLCACCSNTTESILLGLSKICCPKSITVCKRC